MLKVRPGKTYSYEDVKGRESELIGGVFYFHDDYVNENTFVDKILEISIDGFRPNGANYTFFKFIAEAIPVEEDGHVYTWIDADKAHHLVGKEVEYKQYVNSEWKKSIYIARCDSDSTSPFGVRSASGACAIREIKPQPKTAQVITIDSDTVDIDGVKYKRV